jgi:hypothetical protein
MAVDAFFFGLAGTLRATPAKWSRTPLTKAADLFEL